MTSLSSEPSGSILAVEEWTDNSNASLSESTGMRTSSLGAQSLLVVQHVEEHHNRDS